MLILLCHHFGFAEYTYMCVYLYMYAYMFVLKRRSSNNTAPSLQSLLSVPWLVAFWPLLCCQRAYEGITLVVTGGTVYLLTHRRTVFALAFSG